MKTNKSVESKLSQSTLEEINRVLDLARERDPSIEAEFGYSCGDSELHWAVPDADEFMTQLAAFRVSSSCLKQHA